KSESRFQRFDWLSCSHWFSLKLSCWFKLGRGKIEIFVLCFSGPHFVPDDAEHDRHEKERRNGREQQSADDSATERRVLFAAFTETERHRHHADDHRERRHQYRAQSRVTGEDRGVQCALAFA